MLPATDRGVVEDEAEGDRVAVCVAESVESVFVAEILALSDDEVRPVVSVEDGEDVDEFGGERRNELGDGQVELGNLGALLLLSVGGFDLDSSRLAMATIRDQKVHTKVERREGNDPIADEELGGNGVFTGLAGEKVGDIAHQGTVLMAANWRAASRS